MLPNSAFVFLIVVSTPTLLSRAFNDFVFWADATVFSCALVQPEWIWILCKKMSCNPYNTLWHGCLLSCIHKHTVIQWLDYVYILAVDVAVSVFPYAWEPSKKCCRSCCTLMSKISFCRSWHTALRGPTSTTLFSVGKFPIMRRAVRCPLLQSAGWIKTTHIKHFTLVY